MSEAAEDQGWGRESIDRLRDQLAEPLRRCPQPGIQLPDEHEQEVGKAGIAAAREAIKRAAIERIVGADKEVTDEVVPPAT